jgi:hypothetical protein
MIHNNWFGANAVSNLNDIYNGDDAMTEPILSKICTKCKIEKLLSEFHKDKYQKSGICPYCKLCVNNRKKAFYSENNKQCRERNRQYYKKHSDKIIEDRKIYYNANKDKISKRAKKHYKTEHGKNMARKAWSKYRAIKINAITEDFTPQEIFKRDNYICQSCHIKTRPDFKNQYHPKYPHLDHITPLSLGGEHTKRNAQCLCSRCNLTKHNTGTGDQLRLF